MMDYCLREELCRWMEGSRWRLNTEFAVDSFLEVTFPKLLSNTKLCFAEDD